jgi:hypothetical protein
MVSKNMFQKSIILLLNNRVKLISETDKKYMFEVLDEFQECQHNVIIQIKKGRVIITCDCWNCSNFLNTICYNKIACLDYYKSRMLKLR